MCVILRLGAFTMWLGVTFLAFVFLGSGIGLAQSRVLLDAHNCYPEGKSWTDRIDRALSIGTPLAIEQDLAWYVDHGTGRSRSVL